MKKILFVFEKASQDHVAKTSEAIHEKEIICTNGENMKIFQIDEGEIKQVYPERTKVKLGELEYTQ